MNLPVWSLRSRPAAEHLFEGVLLLCGLFVIVSMTAILWVLLSGSLRFFEHVSVHQLIFAAELPSLQAGVDVGILSLLSGTLLTSVLAVVVSLPLGLLSAIYLSELAPPVLERVISPAFEFLSLIPTVVFGYFALFFCTPLLQRLLPELGPHSALSSGLVMGIMLTPFVAVLSVEALRAVPPSLREAACALGVSRLVTIFRVVLPAARVGILSAVALSAARAFGESMIVSIAAGHRPGVTLDPLDPVETMTSYILSLTLSDGAVDTAGRSVVFVVGGVLFLFTVLMHHIGQRLSPGVRGSSW